MTQRLLLGIDLSTTSAKALLIDEGGAVVASAATPLGISTPRPLWSLRAARQARAGAWRECQNFPGGVLWRAGVLIRMIAAD